MMNRRNVLRYSAYTVTGAALLPLIQSCKSATDTATGFKPSFFDPEQFSMVSDICDVLLPETDTPGAVSLGVPAFFDHMVGAVFPTEQKEGFRTSFGKLQNLLDSKSDGGSFAKLSSDAKQKLITDLDRQWHNDDSDSDEKAAYLSVRSQAISYYLGTEEVATNQLNYLPVPGQYEGCITLASVGGKAWAI